jgi:hypothetical protein
MTIKISERRLFARTNNLPVGVYSPSRTTLSKVKSPNLFQLLRLKWSMEVPSDQKLPALTAPVNRRPDGFVPNNSKRGKEDKAICCQWLIRILVYVSLSKCHDIKTEYPAILAKMA